MKIKNVLLTIIIIIFSFYYTNKVSTFLKQKDPIMIKIKKEKANYENKPIDAIINNDTIIPGKKGQVVDINKSYQKMKKLAYYSDSLYVYNYNNPALSLQNQYDKVIIKGNFSNKNISLLIKIKDLSLLNKISHYEELNIIIDNNYLNLYYNYFLNLKNNLIVLENNNINKLADYCYIETDFQKLCQTNNLYTIKPIFITYDIYYNTYKLLENGNMFAYNVANEKDLEKVLLILSGLKNVNYQILSIDKLIKE